MNLNYTERTYNEIFPEMIQDAQNLNLISEDEQFLEHIDNLEDIENNYVMDLSTHALQTDGLYKEATKIYNSNDINKAVGIDLDNLGELFNVKRPAAQKSVAGLTFSLNKSISEEVIIPEGTVVQTDLGEKYVTVEDVNIPANDLNVTVNAKSVLYGYASRVGKNTLVNLSTVIDSHEAKLTVTNLSASSGGKNQATDEEYRELLRNWTKILTRGTKLAYDYYLMNYEGVDSYKLIPHWDGAGTLKIVIDAPAETLPTIIPEITAGLIEDVHLYKDDDVIIVPAEDVTITNVTCTVNVDIDNLTQYSLPDKETISLKVQNAITTYIDGGYRVNGEYYAGLKLGEDFIPYQCGLFVAQEVSEVKNVIFSKTDHTVIDDYQKAEVGVVNVFIE